jgi:hypothetical protein
MCGQDDHTVNDADPIHVNHVFEDDQSLVPLAFISTNFEAERGGEDGLWSIRFVSDEYLDAEG